MFQRTAFPRSVLLAGADSAIEICGAQDLPPVDYAVTRPLLVTKKAVTSRARAAGHQVDVPLAPEALVAVVWTCSRGTSSN